MERRTRDLRRRVGVSVVGALLLVTAVIVSPAQAAGVPYATGDVFAGTGNGFIKHFSPTGTLLDTLDTTSGSVEDIGMCFEASGNLISANFQAGTTSKFDNAGNLLQASWAGPYSTHPEDCVRDGVGNIYVGEVDGLNRLQKFNSAGTLLATYSPATQFRGIDWFDLAADQCTMLYTSEGPSVKSFNVCSNTQNPDFATGLASPCYALRIRTNGEVMVTCLSQTYRLSSVGAVLQTYPIANEYLFAMNLDPDGASYWTAGYYSGNIYKVDIATGAGTSAPVFNAAPSTTMAGLAIFGEPTAAGTLCSGTGACFTGGGTVGAKLATMGFELHCDTGALPNNLQVNWKNNKFHLDSLTTVSCTNDPAFSSGSPSSNFNTISGTGTGRFNGASGATVAFTFTDQGEPGTSDTAAITITVGAATKLNVSATMQNGNLQAH